MAFKQGIAIHHNRLFLGSDEELRQGDIPFQVQRSARSLWEMRPVPAFMHGERLHGRHHGVGIEIKAGREVFRSLHTEFALAIETFVGKEHSLMEAAFAFIDRIVGLDAIANDVLEAKRMVLHHHQRLGNVRKDAARHQPALERDISTIEVIEAFHGKGFQTIVELAHQRIGQQRVSRQLQIEHATVDVTVELVGVAFALEFRKRRRLPYA